MPGTYIIPIEVDSLKLQNKKILCTAMKDTNKWKLRVFIVIDYYYLRPDAAVIPATYRAPLRYRVTAAS